MDNESQFQLFRQPQEDISINFNLSHNNSKNEIDEVPITNNNVPSFRALNPSELFKHLPEGKRQGYYNMAMNDKKFFQRFYGVNQEFSEPGQFFGNLDPQIFRNQNIFGMNKLFDESQFHDHQSVLSHNLKELTERISEIQRKTFNSINLNKTIGSAFYDHFENFSFLLNQSTFFSDLDDSLKNFIHTAKKIKGPGTQLILALYQFWMRVFRDFVNEIWKHSEKFTLNFFKKNNNQKDQKSERNSQDASIDIKGSNSSLMGGQKQKRKQWNTKEVQILNLMIQSNTIFSNIKLKELSEQFNRTTSSISSKIQKMIKQKKIEEGQGRYGEISLLTKLIQTLKSYPEGLNKDQVISRLSETYQMGVDENWKKSITQLLSSRKEISRKKGKFKLNNLQQPPNNSPATFKDRVIQCLYKCQNYEADLKTITQTYLDLYGLMQGYHIHDQYKIKNLEASISKTLCRYDIFDKSKSRTLYFYNNDGSMMQQISIQSFMS